MSPKPVRATETAAQRVLRELYVHRDAHDTNEGRRPARKCPCLRLLVVYQDETFDGDAVWWMLCPVCQSGWVREVPREKCLPLPDDEGAKRS